MTAKKGTASIKGPASGSNTAPTSEELIKFYKNMLLIRRFEERAGQLYGMGLIGGFCHLYIGQEAVVVGLQACTKPGDTLVTSYRDHGHMLACGMEPKGVMAELTGRATGYSRGKGGSMHMFSREKGFFGGHGIVGAQVPIGTGLAFAHKYKGDGGLCMAYMGDGAFNQGQVYESLNMASLWNLPVLYVVENNKYGMGTSVARASASTDLASRGQPYNVKTMTVDGMDVIAMREAGMEAVEHMRAGNGPVLMEAKTYRYRGHSMSDPAKYRTKEELQKMRVDHDPIEQLRQVLINNKLMDDEAFKALDKEIKEVVIDAADFAQTSPQPDPSELWTDIIIAA
jgi:pyruvate dehydrogenase E1 component alpha subunit